MHINKIIKEETGLEIIEIKKLDGYDNKNYLIKTNTDRFVFKTYKYSKEILELVKAENKTLIYLYGKNKMKYPKPIVFSDGSYVKIIMTEGNQLICRILSFLDGESLGSSKHSEELFQSFGLFLAQMDLHLQGFKNETITARKWEWNIQYLELNREYINDISNKKDIEIIEHVFQEFEKNALPILTNLRKQIIHNDANDWNTLVKNGSVTNIIDFGDLAYSPLINELAVGIAYATFEKNEPLKWADIIVKSYNSKLPLTNKEIKVLYYLIIARLAVSICNAAHSKIIDPQNNYAVSSEKSALNSLYRWLAIGASDVEKEFFSNQY